MGDLFDFWFEYSSVVPKGYVRFLGKLAELTDAGIPIHLFRGNHDMWAFDYLTKELNIDISRKPLIKTYNGKKFFIHHGDGLGPGDYGYKFIKWVFERKFNQWLFKWIHPDLGIKLALFWSRSSRNLNKKKEKKIEFNKETERLYLFAREKAKEDSSIDYFVFGHRHLPMNIPVSANAKYVNLGDWITNFTYAEFDGTDLTLKSFAKEFKENT